VTLPSLTPDQRAALRLAAQERLRRLVGDLNPERLIDYVQWRDPGYLPGWVHHEIARRLERFSADVAAGRSPRLIVMLPPRHGKTQMIGRRWLPWHLAHHPTHEVVYATHGQHLADRTSRAARRNAREAAVLWPSLAPGDVDSVSLWGVRGGGTFQGVGIGGPLVGAGAHVLAIDDYVRDAEAAYSEGQRESVWEWYAHVARTRLSPGGGVVVLATPWHEDDLIGRLLRAAQTDGERFDVVRYPAIAEHDETHRREGEALHPARYDEVALDAIRRSIGSRAWAALYQCRPTPATGGLFQRAWMRTIAAVPGSPHDWEWMISVDATFKGGPGSDFVALQVWCKHRGAHRYILAHAERRRMDYPETRAAIVDLRARFPRVSQVVIEEAANGHALIADLRPVVPGVVGYRPEASKPARAQVAARLFEAGQVELVEAPWTGAYIEEVLQFPGGAHDDQVDATSQALIRWTSGASVQVLDRLPRAGAWR
jgi:predicted phage terminase large subunit-like protein